MKRSTRKGLVTAMVAGGVLASAGYAQADSAADGHTAGSPGVLSGNTIQVPVEIPVNACGNTINAIGLLNPSMGNRCANTSDSATTSRAHDTRTSSSSRPARHAGAAAEESGHGAGTTRTGGGAHARSAADRTQSRTSGGGARAEGGATDSPGLLSGNMLQLPIHLPVNVSGNSVNVVGVGNPSFGNTSANGDTPPPAVPAPPAHLPVPAPPNEVSPVAGPPALAHTGADAIGWTAAGSAGLLLGGVLLYRRVRPGRG